MLHTGASEIGSELEILSKKEAAALTVRIRSTIRQNARLMNRAWEGKVWVPLGFPTFTAWLTDAVGISTARAYQLIAVAVMNEAVHAAITLPENFEVTDRQTREIISLGKNKFIAALRVKATDDKAENAAHFRSVLTSLMKSHREKQTETPAEVAVISATVSSHPSRQQPTQVTAPVRNTQNLLILCRSFRSQATRLPRLKKQSSVQVLREAVEVAKGRLIEFNTALIEGGLSVA